MKYFIVSIVGIAMIVLCESKVMSATKIPMRVCGDASGKVVEKSTNNSLGAVRVWVYDRYGDLITVMSTDMDGKYSSQYRRIPIGNHYFRVPADRWGTKGKYLGQFYNNVSSWRNATFVNVEKDKMVLDIDFYLERGAAISGSVECNGEPIKEDSLSVTVYDADKRYSSTEYKLATDFEGKYTISGVASGKWKLHINPQHYIGTYYGQTEWWDSAFVITVENAKDTIKDIDIWVEKGGKISGQVLSEKTQEPVSNVKVYCSGKFSGTDSLGYFEFTGLDIGEYALETNLGYQTKSPYANQYYKQTVTYEDADLIEIVQGQEVSGINIYIKEGGKIPITVVDEKGLPIPESKRISLIPHSGKESYMNWGVGGSTFEYPNILPGKYTVYVSYLGERETGISYAAIYYKNALRFEDATFMEVKESYKTDLMTIVMKPGGWIQGFMRHNGNIIDGDSTKFMILAYDAKSGNLVGKGYNTFCGGYKIKSLPLGEYKLAVLNQDPYFAIQYYGGGVSFDWGKGERR